MKKLPSMNRWLRIILGVSFGLNLILGTAYVWSLGRTVNSLITVYLGLITWPVAVLLLGAMFYRRLSKILKTLADVAKLKWGEAEITIQGRTDEHFISMEHAIAEMERRNQINAEQAFLLQDRVRVIWRQSTEPTS